jgi:predicted transcriptional regulator with HTH domain
MTTLTKIAPSLSSISSIASSTPAPTSKVSLIDEIQQGRISKAIELIEQGLVDVNEADKLYNWGALHLAVRDNKVALVRTLIQYGADLELRDRTGQTPLHRAAYWGRTDLVVMLIEHGADFTALDTLMQTPHDLARNQGHTETTAELERHISMLLLGIYPYGVRSKEMAAKMMEQMKAKHTEEERRKKVRQEIERSKQEAEREKGRSKTAERKILEKRMKLVEKAERYKDEIIHLAKVGGSNGLTKSQMLRIKELQTKLHKVIDEMEHQMNKISQVRRASVEHMISGLRADDVISYVNAK